MLQRSTVAIFQCCNVAMLNVAVLQGTLSEGASKHAPFDVIVIEGAVEEISDELVAQLVDGGRIAAIFSQKGQGVMRVGYKTQGKISFWGRDRIRKP